MILVNKIGPLFSLVSSVKNQININMEYTLWWMILALWATGIYAASIEPQSISINNVVTNQPRPNRKNHISRVRQYACPIGFFRLKGYCYYLSAGMNTWREAHFNCKDRNATLAVLDKKRKDKILREYLMGDQFTKLERWIAGIFDWGTHHWRWTVGGQQMGFKNFAKLMNEQENQLEWHCVVMDPTVKYKWNPRECTERKHYVCQVPVGRLGRRRKKTIDPSVPTNHKTKPLRKGKKYLSGHQLSGKREQKRIESERNWGKHDTDQQWAHGVRPGARPPSRFVKPKERIRHHSNGTHSKVQRPMVAQILPQGREYGAFLGDSPIKSRPQGLTDFSNTLSDFNARINDFAQEEILLKP